MKYGDVLKSFLYLASAASLSPPPAHVPPLLSGSLSKNGVHKAPSPVFSSLLLLPLLLLFLLSPSSSSSPSPSSRSSSSCAERPKLSMVLLFRYWGSVLRDENTRKRRVFFVDTWHRCRDVKTAVSLTRVSRVRAAVASGGRFVPFLGVLASDENCL